MMATRKCVVYSSGVCLLVITINVIAFTYFWDETNLLRSSNNHDDDLHNYYAHRRAQHNPGLPIILWWTNFMKDGGSVMNCGDVSCYTTNDRGYKNDALTKIFMFYGTMMEMYDLPLPRLPHEQWALIHEESPKNNWVFTSPDFMILFNHSATFKRSSHHPITLQWLTSIEDIESRKHYRSVSEKNRASREEGLAPIAYIQSDCDAPSDRDTLVRMLSKYIKIDCLGLCLHNKDLPKHLLNPLDGMHHEDFYDLLSKYKFVFAAENAICDDYITEKLWRPFYVGTVPIIYGSPTIKDWLPSANSALVVQDYQNVGELANNIQRLQDNDTAYSELLRYKHQGVTNERLLQAVETRKWKVDGPDSSYFDTYVCEVCHYISKPLPATQKHSGKTMSLDCPVPEPFDTETESIEHLKKQDSNYFWKRIWEDEVFRGDTALTQIYKNKSSISKEFLNTAVKNKFLGTL